MVLSGTRGTLAALGTINRLVVGKGHARGDDVLPVALGDEDRHAERCREKALALRLGLLTGAGLLVIVTLAKLALLNLHLGLSPLLGRKEAAQVPA